MRSYPCVNLSFCTFGVGVKNSNNPTKSFWNIIPVLNVESGLRLVLIAPTCFCITHFISGREVLDNVIRRRFPLGVVLCVVYFTIIIILKSVSEEGPKTRADSQAPARSIKPRLGH